MTDSQYGAAAVEPVTSLRKWLEAPRELKLADPGDLHCLDGNRVLTEEHVKNDFEALMRRNPASVFSRVVYVTKKGRILDGQHWAEAARRCGLSVLTMVLEPEDALVAVRNMNSKQRNWQPVDFAHSFITEGNPHYARWMELRERYAAHNIRLSADVLRMVLSPLGSPQSRESFEDGTFVVSDELWSSAQRMLELWVDLYPFYGPSSKLRGFMTAFRVVVEIPSYSHAQMLKGLKKAWDKRDAKYLVTRALSVEYVRDWSEWYNAGLAVQNRVTFLPAEQALPRRAA